MLLNEQPTTGDVAAQKLGNRRGGVLSELIAEHTDVYEISDRIAALKAAATKIPAPVDDTAARMAVIQNALTDGTIDDVDIVATISPAAHAQADFAFVHTQLQSLMASLRLEQGNQLRAAIDPICRGLDTRLKAAVDELRASPITKQRITNPGDAITAGHADAWEPTQRLRTTIASTYGAIDTLVSAWLVERDYLTAPWAVTRLANPEQVWPDFIAHRAELTTGRPPWPVLGRDLKGHGDLTEAWITWLAHTPKAQPTVLHPDALPDRLNQIRQKARALLADKPTAAASR